VRLVRLRVLVSACALAFVLPGAADAGPRIPVAGPASEACPIRHIVLNATYSCAAEFTLRASNGYTIMVSGDPGSAGRSEVELTATRGNASAEYTARGTVTRTGLRASFGRLGRVSLNFRPSGKVRRVRVPKTCFKERPPVVTSWLGTFVGTIRFRGEMGYTAVSAHSAKGGIGDPLANTYRKLECEYRESDAERTRELKTVGLNASEQSTGIVFAAARAFGQLAQLPPQMGPSIPGQSRYLFLVFLGEKAEGMLIFRSLAALGPPSTFVFDDALTSASVTPPPPFTGTGRFSRRADGSTTWTGALSVPLPGLGTVRLTEGGFKAELATQAKLLRQSEEEVKSN
jgi:hypothetical protein